MRTTNLNQGPVSFATEEPQVTLDVRFATDYAPESDEVSVSGCVIGVVSIRGKRNCYLDNTGIQGANGLNGPSDDDVQPSTRSTSPSLYGIMKCSGISDVEGI